jgi:hypothetical protein
VRHELEAGDLGEESARGVAHALTVDQVAGIVVADPALDAPGRRAQPHVVEEGADVAGRGGQGLALAGQPRRGLAQRRAAAGRVHDNGVDGLGGEGGGVRPRQAPRGGAGSGVGLERAAAALAGGHHHVESVSGEDARRGAVHRPEELGHDAALEERHAPAPLVLGGQQGRQAAALAARRNRRHQLVHLAQALRQQGAQQAIEAQALREGEHADCGRQAAAVRHHPPEHQRLQALGGAPPQARVLHRLARPFEQLAEAHARGTGRLAGAAAEAQVGLLGQGFEGKAPLGDAAHQVDAPARRRALAARLAVGRAVREAKTAVDAVECPLVEGGQRARRRRAAGPRCIGRAHRPPAKRPGLRTPPGSKRTLRAR